MWSHIVNAANSAARQLKHSVPNINYGGCAVFAVSMAEICRLYGVDCSLRVLSSDEEADAFMDNYNNWKNGNEFRGYHGLSHVFAVLGDTNSTAYDTAFDAYEGAITLNQATRGRWVLQPVAMDYQVMKKLASNPHGWNNCFNRNYIPLMRRIMKDTFERSFRRPVDFPVEFR